MPVSVPLGNLLVRIIGDASGFQRMISGAESRLQQFGSRIVGIGKALTVGVTLPIVGLGISAIKAASDAQEVSNRFAVVFSDIAKSANDAAKELDKSFDFSASGAEDVLVKTGDLLVGFGFTQKEALKLSVAVAKLGTDLSSFTDFSGGAEGAAERLTKAMLGQSRAVQILGINVNRNSIEYKTLAKEINETTGATGLQLQAMTVLRFAQQQSTNAIGDFLRTNKELANQIRELKSDFKDVRVEIGQFFLPLAEDLVATARDLIARWKLLTKENKKQIVGWALFAATMGPVLIALGTLIIMFPLIVAGWKAVTAAQLRAAAGLIVIAAAIALVGDALTDTNFRVLDMVNSFRIGGKKISTLMQVASLFVMKVWNLAKFVVIAGFELVKQSGRETANIIAQAWVVASKLIIKAIFTVQRVVRKAQVIASAFAKGMAGDFSETAKILKEGIATPLIDVAEDVALSGLDQSFRDNLKEREDTFIEHGKLMFKLQKDFVSDQLDFDKTIADAFSKDAEQVTKSTDKISKSFEDLVKDFDKAKSALEDTGLDSFFEDLDKLDALGKTGRFGSFFDDLLKKLDLDEKEGEISTVDVSDFKQISLGQFALTGKGGLGGSGRKEQEVKAKGVEDKLDITNELLRQKTISVLG